jgi:hypothetical protein
MPGFGGMGGMVGGGSGGGKTGMGGGKAKTAAPSSTWSDLQEQFSPKALPSSYHKGGKVRRGGWAKLKKGEIVLSAAQGRTSARKAAKKNSKHATRKRYAK